MRGLSSSVGIHANCKASVVVKSLFLSWNSADSQFSDIHCCPGRWRATLAVYRCMSKGDAMIKRFKLLRNLGQFKNEDSGSRIPLRRLTLCYAGNARGKTTLAAVLRSFSSGDPKPLLERRRVNSSETPRVAIETDSPQGYMSFHQRSMEWHPPLCSGI